MGDGLEHCRRVEVMACNRLRLGFMFSLSSVVLSRDDAELVGTKVGRVIRQQASLRDLW